MDRSSALALLARLHEAQNSCHAGDGGRGAALAGDGAHFAGNENRHTTAYRRAWSLWQIRDQLPVIQATPSSPGICARQLANWTHGAVLVGGLDRPP